MAGGLPTEQTGQDPGAALALLGVHLAALVTHGLQGMGPDCPARAAQLFVSAGAVLDLQGMGGGMV